MFSSNKKSVKNKDKAVNAHCLEICCCHNEAHENADLQFTECG